MKKNFLQIKERQFQSSNSLNHVEIAEIKVLQYKVISFNKENDVYVLQYDNGEVKLPARISKCGFRHYNVGDTFYGIEVYFPLNDFPYVINIDEIRRAEDNKKEHISGKHLSRSKDVHLVVSNGFIDGKFRTGYFYNKNVIVYKEITFSYIMIVPHIFVAFNINEVIERKQGRAEYEHI